MEATPGRERKKETASVQTLSFIMFPQKSSAIKTTPSERMPKIPEDSIEGKRRLVVLSVIFIKTAEQMIKIREMHIKNVYFCAVITVLLVF